MDADVKRERLELVGLAEAAALLGLSKSALWARRRPGAAFPAPAPLAELACGPIWLRSEIEQYARELARQRATFESLLADALHSLQQDGDS